MRLGLVGTGPRAKLYLLDRNGGESFVAQIHGRCSSAEYRKFLGSVDGVVVATHPEAHEWQARMALSHGIHVLCEKPLALTLGDARAIISEAIERNTPLHVAHTHLFRKDVPSLIVDDDATCMIRYTDHRRSYSAWLDWAPHGLAMLARDFPNWSAKKLAMSVSVAKDERRCLRYRGVDFLNDKAGYPAPTPMWFQLRAFMLGRAPDPEYLRRIYTALFEGEHPECLTRNQTPPSSS